MNRFIIAVVFIGMPVLVAGLLKAAENLFDFSPGNVAPFVSASASYPSVVNDPSMGNALNLPATGAAVTGVNLPTALSLSGGLLSISIWKTDLFASGGLF